MDRTKDIEKGLRKAIIQDDLEQHACEDAPNDASWTEWLHNYGNLSIFFTGDFNQLEPVNKLKKHIYKQEPLEFKDLMNCFTE